MRQVETTWGIRSLMLELNMEPVLDMFMTDWSWKLLVHPVVNIKIILVWTRVGLPTLPWTRATQVKAYSDCWLRFLRNETNHLLQQRGLVKPFMDDMRNLLELWHGDCSVRMYVDNRMKSQIVSLSSVVKTNDTCGNRYCMIPEDLQSNSLCSTNLQIQSVTGPKTSIPAVSTKAPVSTLQHQKHNVPIYRSSRQVHENVTRVVPQTWICDRRVVIIIRSSWLIACSWLIAWWVQVKISKQILWMLQCTSRFINLASQTMTANQLLGMLWWNIAEHGK